MTSEGRSAFWASVRGRIAAKDRMRAAIWRRSATLADAVLTEWRHEPEIFVEGCDSKPGAVESTLELACCDWPWFAVRMLEAGADPRAERFGGVDLLRAVVVRPGRLAQDRPTKISVALGAAPEIRTVCGGGTEADERIALFGRLLAGGVDAGAPGRPRKKGATLLEHIVRTANDDPFYLALAGALAGNRDAEILAKALGKDRLAAAFV